MTDKDNLVGTQYGLLTIIDIFDTNKAKCRCECGNEIISDLKKLKYGKQKSCGCLTSKSKLKDISGQRFGKLMAIEYTGKIKNHSAIWLCQCDCILDESRKKAIKKALDTRQEQYVEGTDIYQLAQEPRTNNTSGVVGVTYDKSTKTWKAKIEFKKKRYYLGSSKDIDVAIKLRKEAEEKLHGEFLEWYEMNVKGKKQN